MSWQETLGKLWSNKEGKLEQIPGHFTQYSDRTDKTDKQQLVIGLDFGTAFTKVVIGESRVSYAVPFSSFTGGKNIYLLPGVLSIDKNGQYYLGNNDASIRRGSNLKMRLLQGDYTISCQTNVAAFLALVLRHCRAWLLNEHKKTYQNRYLDWFLNVGLPTDNYHDDELTNTYRKIVQAAWHASIVSGPVTMKLMKQVLEGNFNQGERYTGHDDDVDTRKIHPDAIELFPEFVAQITGYVRSSLRQSDLHVLVDVGAGTIDVTIFNVYEKNGEDVYPILAKSVKPLGVRYLVRYRLKMCHYDGDWKPKVQDAPPPIAEFATRIGLSSENLQKIDKHFWDKVYGQISEQLIYTKKHRYVKSQGWIDGIPLFLCGGGAKSDFYIELIHSMEAAEYPCKLRKTQLPKPERLEAEVLSNEDYDRLSVAYGLSFDAFDIGEIQKFDDIDDDTEVENIESAMCSLCNGSGGPRGNNDCRRCGGSGFMSNELNIK